MIFTVLDDEGTEVAQLNVSREEAEDIVEAWNADNSPIRWNRPFILLEVNHG